MKVFSRFALILLLLLIGVLLGAWTYLSIRYGSVEDFLAGDDGPHYWQPASGPEFEEEPAASATDPSETPGQRAAREAKREAEEAGKTDWRAEKPNAPAPGKSTPDEPQATLEAEADDSFTGLEIEMDGKIHRPDGENRSSGVLVVRTRPSNLADRPGYFDPTAIESMEKRGVFRARLSSEMRSDQAFWARGRVVDRIKNKPVVNSVVALQTSAGSSVTRAITNINGDFALWVGETIHDTLVAKRKPLSLTIYADGLKADAPAGGSYSQVINPDANGTYVAKLDRSRGLRVRVRLSSPAPQGSDVRVWCEQLSATMGCLYDDSIFMSAPAPAQGDVVFRLPGPMAGVVRIGAIGEGWASSEVLETAKTAGEVISTGLTLEPCSTFKVQGSITYEMRFAGSRLGSGFLGAARIAGVDSRFLTYSDNSGRFSLWFPVTHASDAGSLTISHTSGIQEVLEFSTDVTAAPSWARLAENGTAPYGPWELKFDRELPLELTFPEVDEALWSNPKHDLYTWATAKIRSLAPRPGAIKTFGCV